ncbi:MAG: GH92 family glycosyl hydrolase, partial [Alistipes sp.]|nr:GH92 family glycosyl hydrolase [Alistipes sp.]
MIKKSLLTLVAIVAIAATAINTSCQCNTACDESEFSPADYVNPLVGTLSEFALSTGNTYPAIARPWGMNFWSPQTGKMGNGWMYVYTDHKIRGFKQTHQPSPWINDYGQFSLMPVVGAPEFDQDKRASWFSHKGEEAKAFYYKVYLAEHDVLTEFSPTERAVLFRFTFPQSEQSYVVVDAFNRGSHINIDKENNRITGYTTRNSGGVPEDFKNYFVVEFDKPFEYIHTFVNGELTDATEQTEDHVGAVIGFKTKKGEAVHARVASSFISHEQAALNLKELGDDTLEELTEKGRKAWNDVLGRIEVEGGNLDQYRTFYSCLYRATLFPQKHYEIDANGEVVHYSPHNGKVEKGYFYTGTGFWDTFRCLFPLLNMLYPSENQKMQEGFINVYKESGFFPEWSSPGHRGCMVGNNSASVLADAYLKGVKVEDTKALFEGLVHGTENMHPTVSSTGRRGHEYYNTLGYVPYDVKINESAARTLEYAYDDWCIYKMAKELNQPQEVIDRYAKRAMNYRNLFDKETNLMRGRNADGTFQSPFSPLKWGDAFTEGNSWHYTWSVFHDPQGLIDLMGGDDKFVEMLDSVFTVPPIYDDSYYGFPIHEITEMTVMNSGNYAHGNQPVQHMIYLYDYAGQPWKAQYWVRQVIDRFYSAQADGYCGDEDNGQTSAWYVFSALGFYPVCPGTDQYIMGAPLFKKAT